MDLMGCKHRKTNIGSARSRLRALLERMDARLVEADPNFEQAKIDKLMLIMFGPEPDYFEVPEEYRHLSEAAASRNSESSTQEPPTQP